MNGHDRIKGPQSGRNVVGDVCEDLVADLIGGRRWPSWPLIPVPRTVARDEDGEDFLLTPDLFWPERTAYVEVKAGIAKFYVTVTQHAAYGRIRDRATDPIDRPRVFYAFVAYKPELPVGKKRAVSELVADVLAHVRFVLILDSRIVDRLASEVGSHGRDWVTPLSPMLGAWRDLYFFTPGKIEWMLSATRRELTARFGSDQRVRDIAAAYPVRIVGPKRRARTWRGPLPFEQTDLFDPARRHMGDNHLDEWTL